MTAVQIQNLIEELDKAVTEMENDDKWFTDAEFRKLHYELECLRLRFIEKLEAIN